MVEIKINALRGIPPGIRTRKKGVRNSPSEPWKIKPYKPVIKTNILEKLLCEGKEHYAKVIELLKIFPDNTEGYKPEYQALLKKEIDLTNVINQLKEQIQVRKEKKNKFKGT